MKSRPKRSSRKFIVEHLEDRRLLSGGPQGHNPLPPGSLNPRFGNAGIASSAIVGPTDDTASGIAIQRQGDGSIVVAGTVQGVGSQSGFGLTRYKPDGRVDMSFGQGGTVFTPFESGSVAATASAVAIQPDGKIVVAGTVQGTINGADVEEFALARYKHNGTLDTSFGDGGEVLTDFGADSFSSASSIAIDNRGHILVAGTTTIDGTSDLAVARYNSNGSLDQRFGSGGEAVANFGANATVFLTKVGVALQPNGQVVLAGTVAHFTGGFTADFGLARFNSNGTLDQGFGTGGLVDTSFGSSTVFSVAGVALEPGSNAIVVAGTVLDPTFTQDFALARYNATDGSLDTRFGNGGEVITPSAAATTSTAAGLAIQPSNGAILVAGTTSGFDASDNFFQDLTLARYQAANGSLDPKFGNGGEVLTDFGAGSRTTGAGVAVQANGQIVATGSVTFLSGGTVAGFGVATYNPNGSLNPRFGTHGEVITNIPAPSSDVAAGEVIQPDGKIVVVGTASVFGPDGSIVEELALTRFNSDGTVDTNFGNNGSVLTDFGTGTNEAAAVAIQSDGKIVVVGSIEGNFNSPFEQDFGVVRYTKDGSLDPSFGKGGEVLVDFGSDTSATAAGLAIQPNGQIVIAGSASGFDSNDNFFQDFALARLNPSGRLDTSFGTGGEVLTSFGPDLPLTAAGLAIQSDGKIVVAGSTTDPDTFNDDFALVRYKKNGSLDTRFGTGGQVITSFGPDDSADAAGVAIERNGQIVVAGRVDDFDAGSVDIGLASYNPDGSLNQNFGTGGLVTTAFDSGSDVFVAGVTLQPNGQIVVAGTFNGFVNGSFVGGIAVVRYNQDGSLDQGFGLGGIVITNLNSAGLASAAGVAVAPDGKIIVVGTATDDGESDFTLVSYIGNQKTGH